jgi:hypothetical protein
MRSKNRVEPARQLGLGVLARTRPLPTLRWSDKHESRRSYVAQPASPPPLTWDRGREYVPVCRRGASPRREKPAGEDETHRRPGPIQPGKDALSQSTDAAERKIRAQYQPPLFGSACASQHIAPEQSVQDLPEPRGDRLCSNPLLRFSQSQQGSPGVCLYFGQRRLNARLSKRFA